MKRMATVDLESVGVEAKTIAAFLRAEFPAFARSHRAVTLEDDAPAIPALLWREVGWSEAFSKARLAPPERDFGEQKIAARLAEYRSWEDGFDRKPDDLPHPRRLVEDDGQGVGILITDEHEGGVDAPVAAVLAEQNSVVIESESYARWCANEMLARALSRMYSTTLVTTPVSALDSLSTCPWPLLSPATRRFNTDVYAVPPDALATQAHRKGRWTLAHRSVEALVAVLQAAPLEAVTFSTLPGDAAHTGTTFSTLVGTDAVRAIPDKKGGTNWVGTLAGIAIIGHERGNRTVVATSPRRLAELQAALRERGASP